MPEASFWRVLRAAGLIGAAPVLVLLALLAGGYLAPAPGIVGLLACALAALLLARVWIGDLSLLSEALRRAATAAAADDEGGDGPAPPTTKAPLLPAARDVADGVSRLARDLAERRRMAGRLRRADEAIVEGLPDPLLVLSPNRAPLRANAAARALFGAGGGTDHRLGGDVAALLRHPALADAVDRALAGREPQAADLVLPVPVPRELHAQVVPMEPAPAAEGGRLVVLLSDRTRERAFERMRADFVANASHELRTPLASLIGFIETLRGPAEDDPAARARFLAIMAEQSERMRRLIDDLLGLSRIELTEHQPPVGRASLAEIARAEAAALEPLLRGRRMTLVEALDGGEAAVAAPADADQLAQVVRNLLENAVRHGREGGEVRLSVARAEAGGRPGVSLTVEDDGPGIPRQHIPRLTERFYRVDRGRSRAAGGTGLGLAIVKHIVNRHRGQLSIESEEGAGARFRVWLPASPPHG
jgi:two-component system, OmpR family, phosphate regulon sensor histidine kinase PhoR